MKIILPLLLAFTGLFSAAAQAEPTLVIVVRHAERALEPEGDPSLSAEGVQRAQQLAERLANAHVNAIITTHYRRTQETALPTAKAFGIEPIVVGVRRTAMDAHVPEVLAAIHAQRGVVLVVGHSNTVTDIVAGLSGARPVRLCDTSFSRLFIVQPGPVGSAVLEFNYGRSDPAPAADCQ